MASFDEAFTKLLGHEGGYVDHPSDPGGATRWGVTERVARANGYTGHMRDFPESAARHIYRKSYWDTVRADELPEAVRYPVFDAAVNSGPEQSVKWLQRSVGVADDGKLGPVTLAAVNRANPEVIKARVIGQRLLFMTDLKTWQVFGRGWARRLSSLMVD